LPLGDGIDANVWALAVYQNQLIAGSEYSRYGIVAGWDGHQWASVGAPVSGYVGGLRVECLSVDEDGLIAGGSFDRMGYYPKAGEHAVDVAASNIARWDGSQWGSMGAGFDGRVQALGAYRGRRVAAGQFSKSGTSLATNIATWDGTQWQSVGAGIPSIEGV